MSLSEIRDLTDDLLRDSAARISPESRDRAIALAVVRYSRDRPRELVEDVVSAGGQALPLPASWAPGESGLRSVELLPEQVPPARLATSAFAVYRRPDGEVIVLNSVLSAGAQARLTFTRPHQLDDAADTLPAADREAVACYAAAVLADQLSAASADNVEPTIAADRVDQTSPAHEWAMRAKAYRARYFSALGIATSGAGLEQSATRPAGTVVEFDMRDSRGGRWQGRRA